MSQTRRYRVHLALVSVQTAHISIMGAATPDEAAERARACIHTEAVLLDGAPSLIGYEIRETVLERE